MNERTESTAAAWWPLAAVVPVPLGLSRHLFIAACERGDIPIRVARFGERGVWRVNAADTIAYLREQRTPITEPTT